MAVRFLFGVKDKIFSHQMKKLIAIIVVSLFLGINLSFSQPHFFKQPKIQLVSATVSLPKIKNLDFLFLEGKV